VPGHIYKADVHITRRHIGETQIDGDPSPLFLGQTIGIDAGQRFDERGFAVVDMPGGCRRSLP
jgi:hypothetical protein